MNENISEEVKEAKKRSARYLLYCSTSEVLSY